MLVMEIIRFSRWSLNNIILNLENLKNQFSRNFHVSTQA